MSRHPCRVPDCARPTDGVVCRPCARTFERALAETPWLVTELETTITRQTRYGNGTGSRNASRERPMPLDLRASRALDAYRTELLTTARQLDPDRNGPPTRDVNTLARWILLRANAVRFLDTGPDIVDHVMRRFAHARATIDRPADRWFAGPCLDPCGADLYADEGADLVVCRGCGQTYDVTARRAYLLDEAEDILANAVTIARSVSWLGAQPLTAARVRQWAARKRLVARAIDRCSTHIADVTPPPCKKCQPLYRVGDAIDLLATDTRTRTSSG